MGRSLLLRPRLSLLDGLAVVLDAVLVLAPLGAGLACFHLAKCFEGDRILGSLTLVMFTIPTGIRAWIEDVVVDSDARGKGVGALLNEAALDRLVKASAGLTASPRTAT